jgi:hypothetical protein
MVSVVDEMTDLSTLTGMDGKHRELVQTKFRSTYGNITWRAARLTTKDQFLDEYSAGDPPSVRTLLREWMEDYNLEARFKPPSPQQQNGKLIKLRCCFRIHFYFSVLVFLYSNVASNTNLLFLCWQEGESLV